MSDSDSQISNVLPYNNNNNNNDKNKNKMNNNTNNTTITVYRTEPMRAMVWSSQTSSE